MKFDKNSQQKKNNSDIFQALGLVSHFESELDKISAIQTLITINAKDKSVEKIMERYHAEHHKLYEDLRSVRRVLLAKLAGTVKVVI